MTKRQFLAETERFLSYGALVDLIAPFVLEGKRSRPPFAVETMLRVHVVQQWFALSDPTIEEASHDVPPFREFANLGWNTLLPDETAILRCRRLLEDHKRTSPILTTVSDLLGTRGLLLRAGTLVDAAPIAAPNSTKNAASERDPQVRQNRKRTQWHFGMKPHLGKAPIRVQCTRCAARLATSMVWSKPTHCCRRRNGKA